MESGPTDNMTIDLILGTAGHIDHGKTSLIRALTGVDTDRLPEEKKRGITIDLGFAELQVGDYRMGIVDVPGHEKFVRNMLAGATGMDLAMLVVAADDSIKQQTREHMEILRLLNLPAGVIAITKCDLAEPDWTDLVEEEVRELVRDCFLADAPMIRTAATIGMGIDELKAALVSAADIAVRSRVREDVAAPFRMAIDRTFTVAGYGAVVTGSVGSGRVRIGDDLLIQPGGHQVRVRGLQNHDRTVEEVHRGQRAAINLAGVHHDDLSRGHELTTPGHLMPSRLLTAKISLLPSARRPLKSRTRLRVHLGTNEVLASVVLLDRSFLQPGDDAPAQLFLADEVVAVWNQPFVIRSESPVVTVGGGHVLDPNAEKLRRPDESELRLLEDLQSSDELHRASAALYFAGLRNWQPSELSRTAGIADWRSVYEKLIDSGDLQEIVISPTRTQRIHRLWIEHLSQRIEAALLKMHEKNPLRSTLDRNQLMAGFGYIGDPAVVEAILRQMAKDKRIRLTDKGIALVGQGPKLSTNERKLLTELIETFRTAGIESPTVAECQKKATKNQQSVPQLISLAAADGDLVEIDNGYYLHSDAEKQVRAKLTEAMRTSDTGLTLSEIRELLNTTRKYAIPLCEYLDKSGFTKREGDVRVLAES